MDTVVLDCGNCGARLSDFPREKRVHESVARIVAGGCPECLAFGPDRYFDGMGRELDGRTWQPVPRWRQVWRDFASARVPGAVGASMLAGGGTSMHIEKGLLKGAKWKKARSFGGDMKAPRFLCLHDTAGRMEPFSSVNWFCDPKCKTSAHFVVERDGTITQMVPTHKRAYHAGVSHWKGVSGLNSCSIGIEIVNPGKMDAKGHAWFGKACETSDLVAMATPNHGKGWWLPYTPEQIKAVTAICRAVVEEYPDCNEILTHWEIAPKRKIDTNPLFPIEELRRVVFDPTPGDLEVLPEPVAPPLPPPPVPTRKKELTKSVSGKLTLGTILTAIIDWFFGIGRWISDALGKVVGVLGPAQQEAETTIAPLMSLTKTLQLNIGAISFWLLVGVLGVVLFRHLGDKVENAKLKQEMPDPPEEAAA